MLPKTKKLITSSFLMLFLGSLIGLVAVVINKPEKSLFNYFYTLFTMFGYLVSFLLPVDSPEKTKTYELYDTLLDEVVDYVELTEHEARKRNRKYRIQDSPIRYIEHNSNDFEIIQP